MQNFNELGLPESLNHTLQSMQFTTPTPIQAQAIPYALEGKDILGSAQTGTGKTGAFGIPLVAHLLNSDTGSALVMTPTRELATQVMTQLQSMLGRRSKVKTALLIGGESMPKQFRQLNERPRLFVGTPGRINDHLQRGSLKLNDTQFLVLDETDRMLDMGFTIQIDTILERMPSQRQTMLFSATLPKNIVRIAEKYLNDPIRVAVSPTSAPAANIKHDMVRLTDSEKYGRLLEELNTRTGSIIMFMKTKFSTERMVKRLSADGHHSEAIHGDLRQSQRDRVISSFRQQKYRILVATDVASRGLDIPHIEHVINYDLPQCAEDYIHRIGRTARAGAEGSAVCFVTPSDNGKWYAINRLMNPNAPVEEMAYVVPHKRGKKPFKSGGKKPFGNAEAKPFKKFEDRSFKKSDEKPFRSAEPKPFKAIAEAKPFRNAEAKPFRNADAKPFRKSEDKPFRKAEGSSFKKPDTRGGDRRVEGNSEGQKPYANSFKYAAPKKDGFKKDGFKKDGFKKDGFKKDGFKKDGASKSHGEKKQGQKHAGSKHAAPKNRAPKSRIYNPSKKSAA